MAEDLKLYVDCCGSFGSEIALTEAALSKSGLVAFEGKFQHAGAINKNKRIYPRDVLEENVDRLKDIINERQLIGELDHPTDSILHFANASHIVTKLWWEGDVLMGRGEILNTPSGKVLKALLEDGVKIGISSRGVGNGKVNEDGVLVIGESYKLITFDAVADPSTHHAFQERVAAEATHVKEPVVAQQKTTNSVVKNEQHSIDTVNKELLIAYLGGFVTSHTDKLRSRLK